MAEDNPDCCFTINWSNIDAVKLGSLELLQRQFVHLPNEHAIEVALRNGHLAVAKWFYQSYPENHFPDIKHSDCDCELDELCQCCTWNRVDLEVANWLFGEFKWKSAAASLACMHNMAIAAASKCKLDVLKYLSSVVESLQTHILYRHCIHVAAANGHLSVIQWLHVRDQPYTAETMDLAASNGHMNIILGFKANDLKDARATLWTVLRRMGILKSSCGFTRTAQKAAHQWLWILRL